MNVIHEAREHLKQCNGCEKELTPATIGDLVLSFNSLLVDAQRESETEQRERESEQTQVMADHRRELSEGR